MERLNTEALAALTGQHKVQLRGFPAELIAAARSIGRDVLGELAGKSADGHAFPYGDYLEIAVDSTGVAQMIWGAGASFDGPGGVWFTRGN